MQRAQLSYYDEEGHGVLYPPQLQRYLQDTTDELTLLEGMESSFLPHYLRIAARKFLFFHGKRGARQGGKEVAVRLTDLLNSPVMLELQELRAIAMSSQTEERDLSSNWFSLQVN
eukprot:jgi/Chrzof1/11996/Cz06g17150.t1